jgi:hypothetical protein
MLLGKSSFFGCVSLTDIPPLIHINPHYKSTDYCEVVRNILGRGSVLFYDRHPVHILKAMTNFVEEYGVRVI